MSHKANDIFHENMREIQEAKRHIGKSGCECNVEENGQHSCGQCYDAVSEKACKEQNGHPLCERCGWLMS